MHGAHPAPPSSLENSGKCSSSEPAESGLEDMPFDVICAVLQREVPSGAGAASPGGGVAGGAGGGGGGGVDGGAGAHTMAMFESTSVKVSPCCSSCWNFCAGARHG